MSPDNQDPAGGHRCQHWLIKEVETDNRPFHSSSLFPHPHQSSALLTFKGVGVLLLYLCTHSGTYPPNKACWLIEQFLVTVATMQGCLVSQMLGRGWLKRKLWGQVKEVGLCFSVEFQIAWFCLVYFNAALCCFAWFSAWTHFAHSCTHSILCLG